MSQCSRRHFYRRYIVISIVSLPCVVYRYVVIGSSYNIDEPDTCSTVRILKTVTWKYNIFLIKHPNKATTYHEYLQHNSKHHFPRLLG